MDATALFRSDPRQRPKPFTFVPPKRNGFVIAICKQLIAGELRRKLKVVDVEIPDGDLETLRAFKGKRCLLVPTHSGGFEPYVVFYLSKLLRDDYHYLSAMEAFEATPLLGKVMQRLGVYSIIRGAADRSSFQMTRKILAEARRWLVIFAEGQTVWQNDTVIPFQQGVFQLAFKAYEDVARQDPDGSLYCLPLSIKYVYLENMDDEIRASLARLESQLFIDDESPPREPYERLRRIGHAVLAANEKKHNITPPDGAGFDDRIQGIKERIVERIERHLEVTPRKGQDLLDRIRTLFNAVDRIVLEEPGPTPYEEKLLHERQQAARDLYDDLWRVLQFIAIYGEYVQESMTVERFMDALCLLEKEVFDERRMWGPRRARIRVGTPIDLKDRFEAYKNDRRSTVHEVTLELESDARRMLESLSSGNRVAF